MIQMIDGKKKHDGLEQKDVRDFLAKQMRDVWGFRWLSLDFAEKKFEEAKHQLEMSRQDNALRSILEKFGWEEHDVSDYEKYVSTEYFSFIGTEEEVKGYIEYTKKLMENEE